VPRPRAAMRQIREVLRLHETQHLSARAVGIAVGLPRTTVRHYLDRARDVGLSWPLPDGLDDRELEERLFGRAAPPPVILRRPEPDWANVHRETAPSPRDSHAACGPNTESAAPTASATPGSPSGYRAYANRLDVVLRSEHRAGEKLFLDFAGDTIPIVDRVTGEITRAQLFVAVLGASNYTYAEAVPSQALPHWVGAHVRAFGFLGGVPAILSRTTCVRL